MKREMKRRIQSTFLILVFSFIACSKSNLEKGTTGIEQNKNEVTMNSYISIFEIPATDISRAIRFYEGILDVKIEKMEFPGMQMGILPYEEQMVTGVIMKGEGYEPSANGITIYLNAGEDLQLVLDKVEKNGGKVIIPKTAHADESGYFALFLDSEGNKMGLHSPN